MAEKKEKNKQTNKSIITNPTHQLLKTPEKHSATHCVLESITHPLFLILILRFR